VGFIAVGIGLGAGVPLGLLASAKRGWVEEVVMRAADFTFAFPALLSAILLTSIYGPGLVVSITAIGIFNIPVLWRDLLWFSCWLSVLSFQCFGHLILWATLTFRINWQLPVHNIGLAPTVWDVTLPPCYW